MLGAAWNGSYCVVTKHNPHSKVSKVTIAGSEYTELNRVATPIVYPLDITGMTHVGRVLGIIQRVKLQSAQYFRLSETQQDQDCRKQSKFGVVKKVKSSD